MEIKLERMGEKHFEADVIVKSAHHDHLAAVVSVDGKEVSFYPKELDNFISALQMIRDNHNRSIND